MATQIPLSPIYRTILVGIQLHSKTGLTMETKIKSLIAYYN